MSESVLDCSNRDEAMAETAESTKQNLKMATEAIERVDGQRPLELHAVEAPLSEQASLAKLGALGVSKGLARVIHRSSGGVPSILLALAVASEELRLSNSQLREQVERHGTASPLLSLIGLSDGELSLFLYVATLPQGAASMKLSREEPGLAKSLLSRGILLHTFSGIELAPSFNREELLPRIGTAHAAEASEPPIEAMDEQTHALIENELAREQLLSREIAVGRRELELTRALDTVRDRETRVAKRECEAGAKHSALQQKQAELARISKRLVQRRLEQNATHYALRETHLELTREQQRLVEDRSSLSVAASLLDYERESA